MLALDLLGGLHALPLAQRAVGQALLQLRLRPLLPHVTPRRGAVEPGCAARQCNPVRHEGLDPTSATPTSRQQRWGASPCRPVCCGSTRCSSSASYRCADGATQLPTRLTKAIGLSLSPLLQTLWSKKSILKYVFSLQSKIPFKKCVKST